MYGREGWVSSAANLCYKHKHKHKHETSTHLLGKDVGRTYVTISDALAS